MAPLRHGCVSLFTDHLWQQIAPIYRHTLQHPFLQGMLDGSLSEDIFCFYLVQDSLYLKDFSRGILLLGARAENNQDAMMFCKHSQSAIFAEHVLHEEYFKSWNLQSSDILSTPMSKTCLLYTSYLLRVAHERPFFEAIAAFLPCYWIYLHVGQALQQQGSSHPLYQLWIENYAGETFANQVKEMLDAVNRAAKTCTPLQQKAMQDHFVMTSKFEYLFWEMAYEKESWPV